MVHDVREEGVRDAVEVRQYKDAEDDNGCNCQSDQEDHQVGARSNAHGVEYLSLGPERCASGIDVLVKV